MCVCVCVFVFVCGGEGICAVHAVAHGSPFDQEPRGSLSRLCLFLDANVRPSHHIVGAAQVLAKRCI